MKDFSWLQFVGNELLEFGKTIIGLVREHYGLMVLRLLAKLRKRLAHASLSEFGIRLLVHAPKFDRRFNQKQKVIGFLLLYALVFAVVALRLSGEDNTAALHRLALGCYMVGIPVFLTMAIQVAAGTKA